MRVYTIGYGGRTPGELTSCWNRSRGSRDRSASCAEKRVADCHRGILAEALSRRGWGVAHIE